MTSYRLYDRYFKDKITGTLTRKLSKTEFLLEGDKRYWCIFPVDMLRVAKDNIGKQVTITGLVELYCGNLAEIDTHIYEVIVKEIQECK